MNINILKEYIDKISEVKVIGKDFSFGGTDFHFIGFYREGNNLHAAVLSYNEEVFEKKEQARINAINAYNLDCSYNLSVRESERQQLLFDEPILHITKLVSGNTELNSHSSECTLLENGIDDNVILLTEFIRAGWISEKFSCIPFDRLYINKVSFAEDFTECPDFSAEIILSFAKTSKRTLAEIPISIEIGANEKEIELPAGEKIFIRAAKLLDMYYEMEQLFSSERFREKCTPEEIEMQRANFIENFSPCCPRGKYYIAVEYEVPENISLEIKLKSVLDAPPITRGGCMAFIIRSDSAPVHSGMQVKTAVIDTPFDSDTKFIEAEIFSVSVITSPNDITI